MCFQFEFAICLDSPVQYRQKLRRVVLDDQLGICADLEREMDDLVGTYFDEWKAVVDDPERQKRFRQFVNTVRLMQLGAELPRVTGETLQEARIGQIEKITERGQSRPANWPRTAIPLAQREADIASPKSEWKWRKLATVNDLIPNSGGTTYVT